MRESVWHSLKRGGLHAALVAMMLHALLPAGWMPATEVGAPLVVCTAAGAVEHEDRKAPSPASIKDHGVCPFASLGTAAAPDDFVALPAPSEHGAADISHVRIEPSLPQQRFASSAPRAPPHLA